MRFLSASVVMTIRLLMLTGCRKAKIMTLRWKRVDLDTAEMWIVDGKTASRMVHLSLSAMGVLAALPHDPENPWVIPGAKPSTHMTNIDRAWQSILSRARLHNDSASRTSVILVPYDLISMRYPAFSGTGNFCIILF